MNQPSRTIDTSIVLATCSRAALLPGALSSLLQQSWNQTHAVEIIVVDDGSTDDTAAVLAEFQRTSPIPFTVLRGTSQGVAAARNLGSFHARGTWLASFDDDQVASPNWLSDLRTLAEATDAACIGGALALQLPPGVTLDSFGPRARRILGEQLPGDAPLPCTGDLLPATNNVLIRRDVFNAVNGYDISFTEGGEDKDFFVRVAATGKQQWLQPAALAHHVLPPRRVSRANLRWTSLRLGAADARVLQRKRPGLAPLKLAAVRLGVALLRDVPQVLLATLRRDHRARLDVRCSLWYTEGLVRAMPAILSANTRQSAFLRSLDFRARNGERSS